MWVDMGAIALADLNHNLPIGTQEHWFTFMNAAELSFKFACMHLTLLHPSCMQLLSAFLCMDEMLNCVFFDCRCAYVYALAFYTRIQIT